MSESILGALCMYMCPDLSNSRVLFFFITVGITICQRIKTCKLVMFIIALVTVVVAVIGIIVPSVMTRQVQPDLSASGMASPD